MNNNHQYIRSKTFLIKIIDLEPPFLKENTDFGNFLVRNEGPVKDPVRGRPNEGSSEGTIVIGIHRKVVKDVIITNITDQNRL